MFYGERCHLFRVVLCRELLRAVLSGRPKSVRVISVDIDSHDRSVEGNLFSLLNNSQIPILDKLNRLNHRIRELLNRQAFEQMLSYLAAAMALSRIAYGVASLSYIGYVYDAMVAEALLGRYEAALDLFLKGHFSDILELVTQKEAFEEVCNLCWLLSMPDHRKAKAGSSTAQETFGDFTVSTLSSIARCDFAKAYSFVSLDSFPVTQSTSSPHSAVSAHATMVLIYLLKQRKVLSDKLERQRARTHAMAKELGTVASVEKLKASKAEAMASAEQVASFELQLLYCDETLERFFTGNAEFFPGFAVEEYWCMLYSTLFWHLFLRTKGTGEPSHAAASQFSQILLDCSDTTATNYSIPLRLAGASLLLRFWGSVSGETLKSPPLVVAITNLAIPVPNPKDRETLHEKKHDDSVVAQITDILAKGTPLLSTQVINP